jgi:hypothetical protein
MSPEVVDGVTACTIDLRHESVQDGCGSFDASLSVVTGDRRNHQRRQDCYHDYPDDDREQGKAWPAAEISSHGSPCDSGPSPALTHSV